MEGTVQLAMEPEERTILENIASLIQQLLSMQGAPEAAIEEAMPDEFENEENMQTQKAMQDETGDDKAEDRLDNQTDVTDESMTDLKKNLKMLTTLLGQKKSVQKSRTNDPILNELKSLNKTLQDVINTQNAQDSFNHSLMEAVGFSDDLVNKTLESVKQPVNQNPPVQGKDMALFAQELVTQIFKNMPQNQNVDKHPFNQRYYDEAVQKDKSRVIDFICKAKGVA